MFTIAMDTDERDHTTNSRRGTHSVLQSFRRVPTYRTPNVNYRHFKLLTIHEIGPSNSGKQRIIRIITREIKKITRQFLTPCCSLKCLSLSECIRRSSVLVSPQWRLVHHLVVNITTESQQKGARLLYNRLD